jgi:autoinducer 2-degrading protein
MLSIVVHLRVRPGRRDDFLQVMVRNATASLLDEPGCRRFDVVTSQEDPESVLLYEIYDDEAAFAAHRATPHFAAWQEARTQLIVDDSQVTERYDVVHTGQGR